MPLGYSENADDCNDINATQNPLQTEICDGLDNDCDQGIDNDPVDGEVWYTDNDGDGFASDNAQAKILCVQPTDGVQILGDCDDNNIDVSPTGQNLRWH